MGRSHGWTSWVDLMGGSHGWISWVDLMGGSLCVNALSLASLSRAISIESKKTCMQMF